MAKREFRISEAHAARHAWASPGTSDAVACAACGMSAEIVDGTYYTTYPAHIGPDCSFRSAPDVASSRVGRRSGRTSRRASPGRSLLEANVGGIHLRFPPGSDVAFVVAVLGALGRA